MKEETANTNNLFAGMPETFFNKGSYNQSVSDVTALVESATTAVKDIYRKRLPTDVPTLKRMTTAGGLRAVTDELAAKYIERIGCILPKQRAAITEEYAELAAGISGQIADIRDLLNVKGIEISVNENGELSTNLAELKEAMKAKYTSHVDLDRMNRCYCALSALSEDIEAFIAVNSQMYSSLAAGTSRVTTRAVPDIVNLLRDMAAGKMPPEAFYAKFRYVFTTKG